jgi:hypothetical protein
VPSPRVVSQQRPKTAAPLALDDLQHNNDNNSRQNSEQRLSNRGLNDAELNAKRKSLFGGELSKSTPKNEGGEVSSSGIP